MSNYDNEEVILERFRERVAIMTVEGVSESTAIQTAYSESRRKHPGVKMPLEIQEAVRKLLVK